ncbi:hypothetical protein PSTG_18853, partial [Puccinia striiformis f. sp. tritici PST-78]
MARSRSPSAFSRLAALARAAFSSASLSAAAFSAPSRWRARPDGPPQPQWPAPAGDPPRPGAGPCHRPAGRAAGAPPRPQGGSCDPPAAHAAGWPRRETAEPRPPLPSPAPPRRQDGRCRQRASRSDDRPGAD